ncbi:FAD synthase [Mycoplasmopsis cynos]|uniref:FAD synthase n=1 Tax=Mycoplasmopsis cynos TaxID=171284 RepID=UPI0029697495|nr:hypothetical protein [Mycoplasmopsis cynos]MCU9933529.1 hypothetical protein [Mycoplasmopsis cynos]WQQ13357.1 hypothetical protein RRG58_01215 [Mycoplasmopsis cynos]WQQ13633.1 hypothetical protein RRG52_02625 [Mycoplasmopsis cynos]WQQ17861.1 hypothetical protein RRG56_00915 [Mycoplasmopsis cynos]
MNDLLIYNWDNFDSEINDNFIIGSFESFHLGHYQIYKAAFEAHKKNNGRIILITFNQETFEFKNKGSFFQSNQANYFNLVDLNICAVLELDFLKVKNLTAIEFLSKLSNQKEINLFAGEDFRLGSDRILLRDLKLPKNLLINVTNIEIFKYRDKKISTSFLKELLEFGDIKFLNELLVYNFTIYGQYKGDDIDLNPHQMLPHRGFYIAKVYLNNLIFYSVINVTTEQKIKWFQVSLDDFFTNSITDGEIFIEFIDKIYLITSNHDINIKDEHLEIAKKYFLANED